MKFHVPGSDVDIRHPAMPLFIAALATFSLIALVFSSTQLSAHAAAAVMSAWAGLIWVSVLCARGRFESVVMAWLVLFPYCYYFFSFPKDHPLFTVDRALLVSVVLVLINNQREPGLVPLTPDLRLAGYLWGVYILICFASLWSHSISDVLGSYRLLLDGIVMPALLGLYAIRFFPIMWNLKRVHTCICLLMIGVAAVSAVELFTGTNLLPWPGGVEEWVQSDTFRILRIDGPFESSGILCLVGTFGFFFIMYLGHVIGTPREGVSSVLHRIGILAALAAAFMPMNRGLVIALFVCACLDYFAKAPLVGRRLWNGIFGGLLIAVSAAWMFYPSVFEDRVSRGDNLYQRIAQNQQTLKVVIDHPLLGAGFNLYHELVLGNPRYTASWHGFDAMNIPHSSLFTVLSEGGIIGFIAYVAAQIFLVRAMWRLRDANRLGWQAFIYCVLAYNIYGIDAGIVYFSDLNLFYMFVAGVIFQMQMHTVVESRSAHDVLCQ